MPKQALFTRGEKSAAGKVNELFYNMASQYQDDDEYDHWSSDIEEYFEVNGELGSIKLFFTRVSRKPENQLNASNMTMEGVVNLCYVLDLLCEGPLGDWRVQNVLRASKHVAHMMRSGIGASVRLNDAETMGDITFHQFLAIVKSANDPLYEDYGVVGSTASLNDFNGSGVVTTLSTGSVALWTLPGADRSIRLAEQEDHQRELDIRSVSEGVVGGSNHLRHIMNADEQYYRVRALIHAMNVMMPGESQRMRLARANKGKVESLVASVHKGVQDRIDEKIQIENLRKLQRKAHEIGNLNLSSFERAKLAAEGGGVLNIHKRKCGLCTRLFSKPNLPTQATRGAIEDLRTSIAEKAEKRILVAKFSGKRVEIPYLNVQHTSKFFQKNKSKHSTTEKSSALDADMESEFVLVGTFDAGQEAFQVTHNNGSKLMHNWIQARTWKLFNRAKQLETTITPTDPTVLAQLEAEKVQRLKEKAQMSESHRDGLPPGGRRASRWGKMKVLESAGKNLFGGVQKKRMEQQHLLKKQQLKDAKEAEEETLNKLAQLKLGGKVRRVANRRKAKTMRKYDGVRLCVFCTQFYEHAVFVESKKFIRPRAPQPKVPVFESIQEMLAQDQEAQKKIEEEERHAREQEALGDPVAVEERQSRMRERRRMLDRLPELGEEQSAIEKGDQESNGQETEHTAAGVPAGRGEQETWASAEEDQNVVNDLMTKIGLNLAKIGDIAYKQMKNTQLTNRLRYLAAVRVQSGARSFLVRLSWIKMYAKENNALKAGISEFTEKIEELRVKKKALLKAKREKKKEQQRRKRK